MDKLNFHDKLSYDDIDLTAPDIVIQEIVLQIKDETNGIITGNVTPYDGPVTSYHTSTGISGLQAALGTLDKEIDIQDSLGKYGEQTRKYEFYLSTPVFDQYQYRICFLQYGVANYPVKVILEQAIANEINEAIHNSNYIYECTSRSELEKLIVAIMYSKTVINVMQELIRINQIYKNKKQE